MYQTRQFSDVTIKYNDLVHLKCKVDAYPHANVTWYKNEVRLSKEDGITDDGSELMIQHMKFVNEGKYSCKVKNELHERAFPFEIKISGIGTLRHVLNINGELFPPLLFSLYIIILSDTPQFFKSTSVSLNFKEGTSNSIACR